MGPLRTGFRCGLVAVVVALLADLRFLYLSPGGTPDWILTFVEDFRTQLALAAFLFLSILAALRVRPVRTEPDVPYRSLLLRDGALAATVVAIMAGLTLLLVTFFLSTVFADDVRDYARDASPHMLTYYEKVNNRLDTPQALPELGEIEERLQPPEPRDLGRSLANFVLRAILLGTVGAVVGTLRGSFGKRNRPDEGDGASPRDGAAEGAPGA